MSLAVAATGILVKRSAGINTTSYVTVGELTSVTPAGKSRNKLETSTHNDGSESFVLGILRQGDPGFHINYVGSDATHIAIIADIDGNIPNSWQFAFPSGVKRSGNARVQQFVFDPAPVDSIQGVTCALAWAGPVTDSPT
ncbi:MAG TPA: hypothetical protein VM531_11075 [Sphingomicrobium sp.]|jgi:hypothetical protein|nr:hypothetical protein [Sphingomicrobium sp.]